MKVESEVQCDDTKSASLSASLSIWIVIANVRDDEFKITYSLNSVINIYFQVHCLDSFTWLCFGDMNFLTIKHKTIEKGSSPKVIKLSGELKP